ncbi:Gfo/Idh/MocA family oxidoreductase [Pseudoxanthomonas sangjuensis]|uniref:Gfo/Idh/MocA family protein n=1 Tax=Pseudoxanthomonas sangjuensis TaxID=1503750 RepID=UPI001391883A|nr:Gfo/Idh/MocA family oxidoreductase [Pseudoxanthomonas sangjuensis]KAF1711918.1 glycosyl hydrolase [Pseudoxanthomonas sangjuensis]
MKRRDFVKASALAGLSASIAPTAFARARSRLRVGIVGTGLRGRSHLSLLLDRDDVEIAALCDIEQFMLDSALKMVADAGKPKPRVYTGSDDAWRRMYADGKLDAVVIATPWEWHAPQAIGAMEAKIAVGCEVVAGITLDDHWNVLRTQQRTGTPYMLLENVCYRRDVMAVLNMARQGLFGEVVHLEGGYEHDLRAVKFNSGEPGAPYGGGVEFGDKGWSEAKWRTPHSVRRNGDLYPSHGIGPCAMWADIHRGNRFVRLTSYASKARGLHDYIVKNGGEAHPNAQVKFALGDVVTTQIACANGESILLTHDTSLPRPYSLGFRVQGTGGLWMDVNQSIYLEGRSPEPHKWEPAQAWLDKYDHPLWKKYAGDAAGAGHGGMDFFVIHAFVEAIKRGEPMPIDVYDAVAWSAITPLSEQSIAGGNRTVDFPDFTEGKWRDRPRIFALDDRY